MRRLGEILAWLLVNVPAQAGHARKTRERVPPPAVCLGCGRLLDEWGKCPWLEAREQANHDGSPG